MRNTILSVITSILLIPVSLLSQTVVTVNTLQDALNMEDDNTAVKKLIITGNIVGNDFSEASEWPKFRTLNKNFPNLEAVELQTSQDIPDGNYSAGGMFSNVPWLKSFSATNSKKIGANTFSYCQALETVSFPAATAIGKAAFMFCSSLETVSFPRVIETGAYSFHNCTRLSSINFPVLETIGGEAFSFCPKLPTVSFPKVKTVGDFAFNPCRSLSEITFPVVTELSDFAFSNDESLITAAFGDGFDVPTTIHFRTNVFGVGSQLTNRIDLTLSDNVLPAPNTDKNSWQSNNALYGKTAEYTWQRIIVSPATGMEALNVDNQLRIYPNPVTESFRLSGTTENNLLTIIDMTGKIILQRSVNPDETVFVNHLQRGIYFVALKDRTVKLIKQ